eukprot:COSAG04_NODE_13947_length_586_cov_0.866530_2_plen_98_part_01
MDSPDASSVQLNIGGACGGWICALCSRACEGYLPKKTQRERLHSLAAFGEGEQAALSHQRDDAARDAGHIALRDDRLVGLAEARVEGVLPPAPPRTRL